MAEKVGILGLGLIGRLTAELIMPHGYECYAVRRPSTEDFPDMGGKLVDTPRELAEVSDYLLSALPTVDSARETFYGDDGVLAGVHDGLIIIEMNTFPVASVPAGISTQNMPIGMQIVGKPFDTETVFRIAHAFSKGGPRLYTGELFPKVK